MNESDLQKLLDNQTGQGGDLVNQMIDPLLPMLSLFFIVSIVLTVAVVIAFVVSSIQKHRTHKAILRIDKNLQKLVDAQLSTEKRGEVSDEQR